MEKRLTTSITKIAPLFTILERNGINVNDFLSTEGIDPRITESPDNRLTLEQVHVLTEKAAKLTGDTNIGLHQGEILTGFSNILGYILMNCQTAGEAIEKYCKYQKIADEGRFFQIQKRDKDVIVEVIIMDNELSNDRYLIDHKLAGMITYFKLLTGKVIDLSDLKEVHFSYKALEDISVYRRIFPCKLIFSSSMNALVFNSKILDVPILQPNRELLAVFEKYAIEVLSKLNADDSFTNRVRRIIIKMLQGDTPSIEAVAQKLAMSVRNLQLKLKEEGTTYITILHEVRKDLAISYLKDREVPIAEISYLLGFSEPSVFHRTFKRWTNYTPSIYRTNVLNLSPEKSVK